MVDLMMWLVIAALLLAAAIQGIGYYQKSAIMHQMKSDASGAGAVAFGDVASQGGTFTVAAIQESVDRANWSRDMVRKVESPSNGAKPYIRVSHPSIVDSEVIYLFDSCGALVAGVNVVPKGGSATLSSCGINPSVVAVSMNRRVTGNHLGVAMSANAQKMISGGSGSSRAITSTDGGSTWSVRASSPLGSWRSLAMSSDGSKILAGLDNQTLRRSIDSGATWTDLPGAGTGVWQSVASSADGAKLVAAKDNEYIYTSTDSGATWVSRPSAGTGAWRSIASSDDGTRLIATSGVYPSGKVFLSSDSGATWNVQSVFKGGDWVGATSSSDGTKLAVVGNYDYVYTSDNSGATWVKQVKSGNGIWKAITSSDDGTKIFVVGGSSMNVSMDSGATWTPQTNSGTTGLESIIASPDGSKILAGSAIPGGGGLFVGGY